MTKTTTLASLIYSAFGDDGSDEELKLRGLDIVIGHDLAMEDLPEPTLDVSVSLVGPDEAAATLSLLNPSLNAVGGTTALDTLRSLSQRDACYPNAVRPARQ